METLVDLLAQSADMDVDYVCLRIEVVVPDAFEQHRAGDDLSGVTHEIFQQAEFARLKVDRLAGAADLARQQVHFQIADIELRLDGGRAAPAQERLDPGQELG